MTWLYMIGFHNPLWRLDHLLEWPTELRKALHLLLHLFKRIYFRNGQRKRYRGQGMSSMWDFMTSLIMSPLALHVFASLEVLWPCLYLWRLVEASFVGTIDYIAVYRWYFPPPFLRTASHYIGICGLQLILLPQLFECWGYWYMPPLSTWFLSDLASEGRNLVLVF